ncbi:MAG TPA: DUF2188 domain-containing protein [Phenylobacterium sp.]|jgi:hypothetical protein|nr:DUF2188 domain-containing protein [Phenylobacterium sp.]
MSHVTYKIVEHDGGWAYTVDGSFSETFRTHDAALKSARRAAGEQRVSGDTHGIVYEDASGEIREELSDGHDRPRTDVTG